MKKIIVISLSAFLCIACDMGKSDNNSELVDSLKNANSQLKNGYDNLISSINQINDGFSQIVDAETRINTITFNHDNENGGNDPTADIKENLEFIIDVLADNKKQIQSLEEKLKDKSLSSEHLQAMVDNFKSKLEAKQNEIVQLKSQLEEKNYQIGKMAEKIDLLAEENKIVKDENDKVKEENNAIKNENTSVKEENVKVKEENDKVKEENERVKNENAVNNQIINNQDAQLNTAYYVFGTKSELKQHNILSDGDILTNNNFDKEYFTKVDIRNLSTIPLSSKSVKLLSKHPSGSYSLLKDSRGDYTLKISNPTEFWSLTKYLVIRVK